ncbi:MAG TPA: SxtJ family membrane protein [Geobacteraceae bacterium]|nr:SxtJ family membrane protein [Geobacteraceae bacterium]
MGKSGEKPTRMQVLETFALFAFLSLLAYQLLSQRIFLWSALVLLAVALFAKPLARVVVLWWLKFSEAVARVNSMLILVIVFYGVLTPLAIIYRLCNKDPLQLRRDQSESYYAERNHTYEKSDLEKMW